MRRLAVAAILVALAVAACVPALKPVPEREGEVVTITLTPPANLYSVNLSVLNATTDDERCVQVNETDVGCVLGDLPAGSITTVQVLGTPGTVYCSAYGFSDPSQSVTSYRMFPCP